MSAVFWFCLMAGYAAAVAWISKDHDVRDEYVFSLGLLIGAGWLWLCQKLSEVAS